MTEAGGVRVRGNATAEEIAAVLAAITRRERRDAASDRFEQWRRERIAALRDNT